MIILLHASAKKENIKASGFEIWHCYWSFSSDIMAVKGFNLEEEKKKKKKRCP